MTGFSLCQRTRQLSWQVVGAIPGRRAGAEAGPQTAMLEAMDGGRSGCDSPASRKESDSPGPGLGSDPTKLKIQQWAFPLWASVSSVSVMNAGLKLTCPALSSDNHAISSASRHSLRYSQFIPRLFGQNNVVNLEKPQAFSYSCP